MCQPRMGGISWRRCAPIRPAISNCRSANSTWQYCRNSHRRAVGRVVLRIVAQQVGDPGPLNCAPESLQSLFPHRFSLRRAPPCSSSITLAITSSVVSSMTSTSICAVATSSFTLGRGRSLACMSGSRIPSLRRRVESKSPRTRHRSVKASSRRPRHGSARSRMTQESRHKWRPIVGIGSTPVEFCLNPDKVRPKVSGIDLRAVNQPVFPTEWPRMWHDWPHRHVCARCGRGWARNAVPVS